jgi:hypothetical protein
VRQKYLFSIKTILISTHCHVSSYRERKKGRVHTGTRARMWEREGPRPQAHGAYRHSRKEVRKGGPQAKGRVHTGTRARKWEREGPRPQALGAYRHSRKEVRKGGPQARTIIDFYFYFLNVGYIDK